MATFEEKVDKLVSDVNEIKTALKGYDGQTGLCAQVNGNCKAINKIWIVLAVLAVPAGGGGYGIIRMIMGG